MEKITRVAMYRRVRAHSWTLLVLLCLSPSVGEAQANEKLIGFKLGMTYTSTEAVGDAEGAEDMP